MLSGRSRLDEWLFPAQRPPVPARRSRPRHRHARSAFRLSDPTAPAGVLFDNMTALDNLCTSLIPKAGQHIIRKKIVSSILSEALRWFPKEMLLQPLSSWSYPERLRFSYYRWYLLNPRLLICFFPFAGQESTHHKMIIDLLVLCAQRGMAVWIISSGIDAICEKTDNEEFLRRLHYLNK